MGMNSVIYVISMKLNWSSNEGAGDDQIHPLFPNFLVGSLGTCSFVGQIYSRHNANLFVTFWFLLVSWSFFSPMQKYLKGWQQCRVPLLLPRDYALETPPKL